MADEFRKSLKLGIKISVKSKFKKKFNKPLGKRRPNLLSMKRISWGNREMKSDKKKKRFLNIFNLINNRVPQNFLSKHFRIRLISREKVSWRKIKISEKLQLKKSNSNNWWLFLLITIASYFVIKWKPKGIS